MRDYLIIKLSDKIHTSSVLDRDVQNLIFSPALFVWSGTRAKQAGECVLGFDNQKCSLRVKNDEVCHYWLKKISFKSGDITIRWPHFVGKEMHSTRYRKSRIIFLSRPENVLITSAVCFNFDLFKKVSISTRRRKNELREIKLISLNGIIRNVRRFFIVLCRRKTLCGAGLIEFSASCKHQNAFYYNCWQLNLQR